MILYVSIMTILDKDKDQSLLDEHISYLEKEINLGNILFKGPFTDHSGGLLIIKADNQAKAREVIENDPAIKYGSRAYVLKEWKSNYELE